VIERPFFVEANGEDLFAIVALPEGPSSQTVATLLPAGGYTFSPQRNGWGTRLTRGLAESGMAGVRFDWHGIGDSSGRAGNFALDQPFAEDALAVVDAVGDEGWQRHLLIGHCFGARTALSIAPRVEGLAGVALVSPPVRDHARGEGGANRLAYDLGTAGYLRTAACKFHWGALSDPAERRRYLRLARSFIRIRLGAAKRRLQQMWGGGVDPVPWVSRPLLDQLAWLADSGLPVLFVYGDEENDFAEFGEARQGRLGAILEKNAGNIRLEVVPGSVHGMDRTQTQDRVLEVVTAWAREVAAKP
jgi:hypothetical protein